jgi:hypothetical protein
MQFTGNEDHKISLEDASRLTKNYRLGVGSGAQLGGFFGKTAIKAIIDQDECVGLRIYYALLDNGQPTFVLCGVKSDGDDIIAGELAEIVKPCPPFCSNSKELIS